MLSKQAHANAREAPPPHPPALRRCLLCVTFTAHALISSRLISSPGAPTPLSQLVYDPLTTFRPAADSHLPQPTPPSHVWVRQRQDDTIFLLPEALAAQEVEVAAGAAGSVEAHPDAGSGGGNGVLVELPPGEGCEGDEDEDEEGGEEEEASDPFSSPAMRAGRGGVSTTVEVSEALLFLVLCWSRSRRVQAGH